MSISSESNRVDYLGTGLVTTYSYSFRIFAESHLLVTQRTSAGVESTLVLNTDYTVTGEGDSTGGTIVLSTALEADAALTIRRVLPLTQPTDIRNQGSFFPETHEDAFDRGVMMIQQQQDVLDRSLKSPENESEIDELPSATDRASKFLAFDADGDPIASSGGISDAIPVSAFIETLLDDSTAAAARTTLGAAHDTEVVPIQAAGAYIDDFQSVSSRGFGQNTPLITGQNDFVLPDNFMGMIMVHTINDVNNAHAFEVGFVNLSGTDGVYAQVCTGGNGSAPAISSVAIVGGTQTLRITIGAGSGTKVLTLLVLVNGL